ncbi:MAG: SCO family protein [Polyangiaceae bacterium]
MAQNPEVGERAPLEARISGLVARPLFWIVLLLLIAAYPIGRALARPLPTPPKMRLALPAYELRNQKNEPFGSKDLAGKVYVADFIFTSCPSVCPKLTKRMEQISRRTKNMGTSLQLVTFTVDPENDTPDKLAEFAAKHHTNPTRWTFLTGSLAGIETTVIKGFKIAMGKEDVGEGLFSIFHGEKLVLVDGDGNIRGYYEADDDGVATLIRDADVLVNLRDWGPGTTAALSASGSPSAKNSATAPDSPAK